MFIPGGAGVGCAPQAPVKFSLGYGRSTLAGRFQNWLQDIRTARMAGADEGAKAQSTPAHHQGWGPPLGDHSSRSWLLQVENESREALSRRLSTWSEGKMWGWWGLGRLGVCCGLENMYIAGSFSGERFVTDFEQIRQKKKKKVRGGSVC